MKCLNCNAEWTVPQNISRSLARCPFCGTSLSPAAPKSLSTVEDVLHEILQRFGADTLKNGQKLIALFSDLSPQLKRERLLLNYLVQSGGNIKLLEVRDKSRDEQQVCFDQVCRYLIDEQFIAEDAAIRICQSYSMALGMKFATKKVLVSSDPKEPIAKNASPQAHTSKATTPIKSTDQKAPQPTVPQAPPAVQRNRKKIDSFAKYQKALEDFFVVHGKKPLTYFQIQEFITLNALSSWGITIKDVETDLKDIYGQYATISTAKPIQKPAAIQLVFSPNKRLTTYKSYMDELEQMFLQNNKHMLSTEQIVAFIRAYGLQQNFGIKVSEVEKDLRDIARKYT